MTKRINLALQGGGAHGAFTWGVLDRLLDDPEIEIAAISGTSAGALNGAALKSGYLADGRAGARATLDWLWEQLGAISDPRLSDWMSAYSPDVGIMSKAMEYSPAFSLADTLGRMMSPYALGHFYANPLEPIVRKFDYGRVCDDHGPALFVCATNVRTGKIGVFQGRAIGPEAIMASACLPTLFQAVPVEDPETGAVDHFWDGGYTGNPGLFPLFAADLPDDVVVVNINPLEREAVPRTAQEILNRINEISFNASLLGELRAISFVHRLIAAGQVEKGRMKDVLVHMIADDALMSRLSVATKLVPNPVVIANLKAAGQSAADAFLCRHKHRIGVEATVDLGAMFG